MQTGARSQSPGSDQLFHAINNMIAKYQVRKWSVTEICQEEAGQRYLYVEAAEGYSETIQSEIIAFAGVLRSSGEPRSSLPPKNVTSYD